jgi:multidrug efflux pump subunit AcrB
MRPRLPENIQLTIWDEMDRNFSRLTGALQGSALIGFFLVFTVLGLFLGLQLALWASLGVLVSFSGALALMPWFGLSLNTYTIYAFILVLGMVVDDAIVISENVYSHQQQGRDGLAGALSGTRELAPLVILMVLITVVAFLPGWLLPGVAGRVIGNFAIVVILTLLFSPVDALLILPAHLASHCVDKKRSDTGKLSRVPIVMGAGLDWLIAKVYRPLLAVLLRWRYATLAGFGTALAVALSLVTADYLPVVLKQIVPSTFTVAYAQFPADIPYEDVVAFAGRMERAFAEVRAEVDVGRPSGEPSAFRHVNTAIRTDTIYIILDLRGNVEAVRQALPQIVERWRDRLEPLPAGVNLSFYFGSSHSMVNLLFSTLPRPIDLQVTAADLDTLHAGAKALAQALTAHPGLYNVSNSYQPGKPELRFHLIPEARNLGLAPEDLARQVRNAFYGREALRFFRGRDEIKVMVRYPPAKRRDLSTLYNLPVSLPNGHTVPFSSVAQWSFAPGAATITRQNRGRVLWVGADVMWGNEAVAQTILRNLERQLFPQLEQRFPGLTIELGEERREQRSAMATLARYAMLALLAIYALLAVALRSYVQPLLVMTVIPFSFIGVVAGHLLLSVNLTLYSLVALVAAAGVVVKDSLVLVDRINRGAGAQESLLPALLEAGQARFRPILLTTLTAFLGLMPTLWAEGAEAEEVIPMEVTLAFGVLFSALVILVLVPVFYLILEDIRRGVRCLGKIGLPCSSKS